MTGTLMGVSNTGVRPAILALLTVGSCLSVASLYYMQPLLEQIGRDMGVLAARMANTAMLSQIGYALAMLFVVPLGDAVEKRKLVTITCCTSGLCLLAIGFAPNATLLGVAAFCLGLATATPQLLVPMAAGLASPDRRGRVVGIVMGGLFVGILGGRIISGTLGGAVGWRTVFWAAAGLAFVLAVVFNRLLPVVPPTVETWSYRSLLRSVGSIAKHEWRLRYSCLFGACSFAAFSAFWTTLSFHLKAPPLNLGASAAGLFGVIGIVGVLAAPITGRFADHGKEHVGNALGLGLLACSFLTLGFFGETMAGLVVGVVVLDFAASFNHISNQARNYALRPDATSRVNTIYMTTYFVGGALGSFLGGQAWTRFGWPGVCILGFSMAIGGFLVSVPYLRMRPEDPSASLV